MASGTPFLDARNGKGWFAARAAGLVGIALGAVLLPASGAEAAKNMPTEGTANASNGGIATAETTSEVTTGDIITGNNVGHSVETGGTGFGNIDVSVGDMSSAADLAVGTDIGPQVADAGGGDAGRAVVEASEAEGAKAGDIDVDISSEANVDSDSDATGIGTGGAGGAGGAGGSADGSDGGDGSSGESTGT